MIGITKKTGMIVNLIVDTSVWSLFLRRRNVEKNNAFVLQLRQHIENQDCIHLVGIILQELLDGLKSPKHFELLVDYFNSFPLIELLREDFIEAARIKNKCRSKGIHAGSIDFLIAAVAINRNYPLLTTDKDFQNISKYCKIILIDPSI
jgi:predicted nucleic acid-binding protein